MEQLLRARGYKMLTLTRLHGLLGPLNCMAEGSRLIRRANGISECRKKIINTVEVDVVRCCRAENRCCKKKTVGRQSAPLRTFRTAIESP